MKITFNMQALAKNVMVSFTGNNGLYASFQLHPESTSVVMALCKRLGLECDPSDLHVTAMYSNKAPNADSIPDMDADLGAECSAIITGIDSWVGHNGKTYVVLRLASEKLCELNAKLTRHGAEPTFVPFSPHVTLGSMEGELSDSMKLLIAELNKSLSGEARRLHFIQYRYGDLSG